MACDSSSTMNEIKLDMESLATYGGSGGASSLNLESIGTGSSNELVYSVFEGREKWFIVSIVAFAGFLSTLSANIHLPLLPTLAKEMHVSNTLINLTVFSFMVFQGLSPAFLGSLADMHGRRPAYALAFTIYFISNVALAIQDNFVALVLLRCLQSTGISGTVALGNGVVSDIVTNRNRGAYMSFVFVGLMVGPAIGPAIGGIISQYLGWRAVFWFQTILCGVFMVPFLMFFPETGRNIVGNGSVPPAKWNMSIINYLRIRKSKRGAKHDDTGSYKEASPAKTIHERRQFSWPNPLKTVSIIMEKDVAIVLLYDALVYTTFYCITSSTPSIFREKFGFNDLQLGLCYLPIGVGSGLASVMSGFLMDKSYKSVAKAPINCRQGEDMKDIPLEEARLSIMYPILVVGICVLSCYGWTLHLGAHVAVPLVLQALIGLTFMSAFTILNTFLLDLFPQSPATATAADNLVRCLLAATGTAVIELMVKAMGPGWCFTFIAMTTAIASPLLWVELKCGPKWREERRVKLEARDRIKNARNPVAGNENPTAVDEGRDIRDIGESHADLEKGLTTGYQGGSGGSDEQIEHNVDKIEEVRGHLTGR
ncbi:MAG: hypothetical protein M1839_001588 [Geoglossum umbratile]|nr:MAG: hypothetical protein M1839_001588 [Geoglossum umbratile]